MFPPKDACAGSVTYRFWVHLDPMDPDFRPDRFLAAGSQNGTCREQGHVAVDAVLRDLTPFSPSPRINPRQLQGEEPHYF